MLYSILKRLLFVRKFLQIKFDIVAIFKQSACYKAGFIFYESEFNILRKIVKIKGFFRMGVGTGVKMSKNNRFKNV
jgi:hypothetical protein